VRRKKERTRKPDEDQPLPEDVNFRRDAGVRKSAMKGRGRHVVEKLNVDRHRIVTRWIGGSGRGPRGAD